MHFLYAKAPANSAPGLNNLFANLDVSNFSSLLDLLSGNDTSKGIEKVLDDFTEDFLHGERVSPVVFYVLSVLYGAAIVVGVASNSLMLYAILSKGAMRTARNYFIVILAISDLLLCMLTMPITLWDVLR